MRESRGRPSLREIHSAKNVLEAGTGAHIRRKVGVELQVGHAGGALLKSFLEPLDSTIHETKFGKEGGENKRIDTPMRRFPGLPICIPLQTLGSRQ